MSALMSGDESGRYCLVTGAARRVGRRVALRLAEAGCEVAFTYHQSQGDAELLVKEIEALGRQAVAIRADLTRPEEAVPVVYEQVMANTSTLGVLVNNASIYRASGLEDADAELRRDLWAIHVEAPYLLTRAFAPHMNGGRVINMLDLLGERPWPKFLYYSLTKAALTNLTLGLARELAPRGITVNGIAPGVVEWPEDYPESEREKYLKRVPLGRAGTPDDVAEAVLFLAERADYLTGQVLRLDGGRSIT